MICRLGLNHFVGDLEIDVIDVPVRTAGQCRPKNGYANGGSSDRNQTAAEVLRPRRDIVIGHHSSAKRYVRGVAKVEVQVAKVAICAR